MSQDQIDISHIALLDLFETFSEQISPGMLNGTLIRTSVAAAEKFEVVDYGTLEEFIAAANAGDTLLTRVEGKAVHYGKGLFGLPACPFAKSISDYTNLNEGGMPKIFGAVTERYNVDRPVSRDLHVGIGSGVSPFCAVHQPLRSSVARRIQIHGKPLVVYQLGCKAGSGKKGFAPEEWMSELGFSAEQVDKILDDNACCYAVTLEEE